MQEDYPSAATRHLRDAHHLLTEGSWDNAGYLAGYVAECGIKTVIERAGIRILRHLDEISSDHLLLVADLSFAARRYPLDLDEDLRELREAWKPSLRYAPTNTLSSRDSQNMWDCAERVFGRSVGAMVLDGFLERVPE